MKATDEEYRFHCRMLDPDDLTAFAELAEWLYDKLVHKTLARARLGADPTLIAEAVGAALLEYQNDPQRFDPNASTLLNYLTMAAYRDYLNAVQKERRRAALPLTGDDGADMDIADPDQDIHRLLQRLEIEELLRSINDLFSDPADRQVLSLMLEGERSYHIYAEALGISHLPHDEQDAQVKRIKDRVVKRLRRIRSKLHEG